MGFPRFAVVNAIKSPVTLSKHLKRKLSHQVGEKVSWILKRHSVNIISCIYAAQGIGQDPVVCILQAFKTWQAHRHGCPIYEALVFLMLLKEQGSYSKNRNTSSHGRNTLFLVIWSFAVETISMQMTPPKADPTLLFLLSAFLIHHHLLQVSTWRPKRPKSCWFCLHICSQLTLTSQWSPAGQFLKLELPGLCSSLYPSHTQPIRRPYGLNGQKEKKTAFPFPPFWMLATAQVFKPSSFRTQATATPSKLALREGHSYLQQGPPQATVLAGWQLSLPALCSLRHKMQILHGGPHSPQEPWLLSAPLLSEAPLATVLSISLRKNSGLHSSCTLWPCLLGKVLPQIGGRALVFWLRSEFLCWLSARVSHSAVSDSLWPHRL